MAWADLVASANAAFLSTWGTPATLQPKDGSGLFSITGIIKNPGMEEDTLPGGPTGTAVVRLWVDFKTLPQEPSIGDSVMLNNVSYTIGKIDVDIEGGAVLRLRQNG